MHKSKQSYFRGSQFSLLPICMLALCVSGCQNLAPKLAPAVQETTFTMEAISNCTSILWQEKIIDMDEKDITKDYIYDYLKGGMSVQSRDSRARLDVNEAGTYVISPGVNSTTARKIVNSFTCFKTNQTLEVTKILMDGSSKIIDIDFDEKLISR